MLLFSFVGMIEMHERCHDSEIQRRLQLSFSFMLSFFNSFRLEQPKKQPKHHDGQSETPSCASCVAVHALTITVDAHLLTQTDSHLPCASTSKPRKQSIPPGVTFPGTDTGTWKLYSTRRGERRCWAGEKVKQRLR